MNKAPSRTMRRLGVALKGLLYRVLAVALVRRWYDRPARRSLLLLVALVLAGATALAAPAAQKGGPRRFTCREDRFGKVVDIYFWPHGHPRIPRLQFPAFDVAHVEVYKAHSVKYYDFLASTNAWGNTVINAPDCRGSGSNSANVSGGTTTTKKTKLRCKLGQAIQIVWGPKNVLTVVGGGGSSAAAQITIKKKGSTLTYSKQHCKSVGLYS